MAAERVVRIYEEYIKGLPAEERRELLILIAEGLRDMAGEYQDARKHDIRELRGLGKEIWEGVHAQEYVNRLRDEWEKSA